MLFRSEGGVFRQELERRVDDLGLATRVEFLGHRSDLADLIKEAQGTVLPSRDEGLPLVALEAMAASRPVVASAVGGLPALIDDGKNGLLVQHDSPRDLADALIRLRNDPALRRTLGRAGRAHVATHFSAEQMRQQTLAIFEQVAR